MKRLLLITLGCAFILFSGVYFYGRFKFENEFYAFKPNEDRIFIDSLEINNHEKIYWFVYSGLSHYSTSYLAIVKNAEQATNEDAFFISGWITNIALQNDSLKVSLFKNDYNQLKNIALPIDIIISSNWEYLPEHRLTQVNDGR